MAKSTCKLDGCERTRARQGWCSAHWHRVERTGEPGSPTIRPMRTRCDVEGCNGKHFGNGYCQLHAYRFRENGDPLVVKAPRVEAGPSHPAWQGDAITYNGAHKRLMRHRGRADAQTCTHCPAPADQWAFIHGSLSEQTDPELGIPFSADVWDYMPLCCSCHVRYDRNRQPLGTYT